LPWGTRHCTGLREDPAPNMRALTVCAVLAALSLLCVPAAPGYDAWAWLLWGREVGRLELDTVAGPAWKPLPVAITTLLAPAGGAAPELWLLVARAGAVAAVGLAFVVARDLATPRFAVLAGALAALGVLLTGGFVRHAAVGDAEPLLVALLLGALARGLAGTHRQALVLAGLAALVRPEVWPFLALYGGWLWRAREERGLVLALGVLVPAAWFLPELAGSGELLRSTDRARTPNPGQPATADLPALEALAGAASVLVLPAALLALAARGRAALPALLGLAWIAVVAAMSEAGFSGEPRYLVPGAALVAVSGGAGAARLADGARARRRRAAGPAAGAAPARRPSAARFAAAALVVALAALALPRAADLAGLGPRLAYQRALHADLERAIRAAGGRDGVLACGRPAVGRYRGTLLAWHLDVPKRLIRADGRPAAATFASRLTARAAASPRARGRVLAATPRWRVTCS
jgi:hypothetical protein